VDRLSQWGGAWLGKAARDTWPLAQRARVLLDLRADSQDIAEDLSREPFLRRALEEAPGVRVPGTG